MVALGSAPRRWLHSIRPEKGSVKADALAGLPGAISSVPDGMAAGVLVGVSPIHGLYASAVGPVTGGFSASTRLMVITTTSAAALAAGSALEDVRPDQRPDTLFLLTLLAGAFMVVAGVLRLGRYTRFVSHSVMTGFLTGVAVNIILGQIPDLLGVTATGRFAAAKAFDVLTRPRDIDVPSLLAGISALVIMAVLDRTRARVVAAVVALAVPTIAVLAFDADTVAQVDDIGEIPSGLPLPHLPDLGAMSLGVLTGALAVAAIVLVQGSGVAETAPNRGGAPADANADFLAQGISNVASGLFRGQPVGGSVGQTALNLTAGAKTRWASIWSGIWMVVILVAFSGVVGKVAMPTLAAVLIYAAFGALRFSRLATILRTGPISQVALITTFIATVLLPVAAAVGIGVAISLLLQLNQEAMDLRVVQLTPRPDGGLEEGPAPATLTSNTVTLLDVYGSLFYAGARTLSARLPDPRGTECPVVVLRLRGRSSLGATFFHVLRSYSERLRAVDGQLYVSGVGADAWTLFQRSGLITASGPIRAFEATSVLGESSAAALADAEAWLVTHERAAPASGDE